MSLPFIQDAVRQLNQSGFTQFNDVEKDEELVGKTAVIRPLHIGKLLISYFIGERDTYRDIKQEALNTFRQDVKQAFNDDELEDLCYELNIPFEDLEANSHSGRVRELLKYGERHGRLAEISDYCHHQRNHISWPQFPILQESAIKPKKNLAVVVSINNPALETAADYLAENQIACNYVLITTVPDYSTSKWLPNQGDWDPAVQDFHQTMQHQALKIPRVRRHFFLAVPVPFAFALGCTWGLVHQGDSLYHWTGSKEEGSNYQHVMTSTREWKNQ